jgi:hypothetical protein
MKKLFKNVLLVALIFTNLEVFAQKDKEIDAIDTTSNTLIEKLLNQKTYVTKTQYVDVEKVRVLNFQIIIVENLTLRSKLKGLYLSNSYGNKNRYAYLDEQEIDQLIDFIKNADQDWKKQKAVFETKYSFETIDNLRVSLFAYKNSSKWTFSIKYTNFLFDNLVELSESKSDEFLEALIMVKSEMNKY